MPKSTTSQWDFGELFPVEPTRKVLSVGELTTQVKRLLEKQIGVVWVSGEVTNLRAQTSGHMYFTLKDPESQISCVLFRGTTAAQRDLIADGQKVLLQGEITVYEPRGQYQLIIRAVELQGIGTLQMRFEKLKLKLATEGLFAVERKRALPRYPQRIGLVTSPTGAAIRDVLHVVRRRHSGLEIILAPCRVQGDGAAGEIAAAIRTLNDFNSALRTPDSALDLILVTRGGGSLEDLWAFNEEVVARAIFESGLPVVSAVGHEIDFTISDFVADLRAPTPSVGAELITEGIFSSREFVLEAASLLRRCVRRGFDSSTDDFLEFRARLQRLHPRRRLDEVSQRLDDLQYGMLRSVKAAARERGAMLQTLAGRLARLHPTQSVTRRRETLRQLERHLKSLGPQQVLGRGYSITTDAASGKVIRNAGEVNTGQKLRTHLKNGEIFSNVSLVGDPAKSRKE